MTPYAMTVYRQMQGELVRCTTEEAFCIKEVEQCFQLANHYWNKVKKKLNTYRFETDESEIEFFKMVKPKFTSEIEYYSLLYHSLVFEPAGLDAAISFWGREYERLAKFEAENKCFLLCYEGEICEKAPYYFLRKYFVSKHGLDTNMYDAGTMAITNGDHLVATLLALKRYQPFTKKKLESL